ARKPLCFGRFFCARALSRVFWFTISFVWPVQAITFC
ncbi:MAG: hypothetical protein RJA09_2381, partial [Pseudomonadota bacterium]